MSWDRDWSVETWLESLGLASYSEPFLDNGYDLQELCANIKTEDLDAIGVQDERHRARIFAEASKLGDEARARFKKSKGGGSSGSTDHSGSLGSHGSFPAYSEPWGEDAQKHLYSEVWEQQQASPTDGGVVGGITPALAQLMMPNGGSEKHKGLTFPPAAPSKAPRKKPPVSPSSQVSFTLPAVPPPRPAAPPRSGVAGLNKLQLKLKVLEELQKDRIILSEAPYCKEDGSMDEEKVSELCHIYSERFNIETPVIMNTMRVICKATDNKTPEEPDGAHLLVKSPPILSTSDAYEEPFDVMRDDLSTLKDPGNHTPSPTSPQKKGPKKGGSPPFLQKPKPSSSDSSPEQRKPGSPRSSPHVSPVTSPREHKKFGFFSKKTKKKAARSNSMREGDLGKTGGKAGKAVLTPGKSKLAQEAVVVATPSPALSSKKRVTRPSLSLTSPPSSSSPDTGSHSPGHQKTRTVSASSSSTTASETSPLAPKKIGIIRFSQRSPRPQRKARTGSEGGGGKETQKASLTTSDMALNRVGQSPEPERQTETLRGAQSHNSLLETRVSIDSPASAQRKMVESKEKKGLFGLFKRKMVMGKRGGRGKKKKEEEEEEEEEGGEGEGSSNKGTSFLTASISMPNIASAVTDLEEDTSETQSPPLTPHLPSLPPAHQKSATAPPKPSRHSRRSHPQPPIEIPPPSPDPSPLPQRKVQQSELLTPGDRLIPIRDGSSGGAAVDGEKISSWNPVSPSHLLLNPPRGFESDVFSSTAAHEQVSDFVEPARNSQRDSLASYHSATSETTGGGRAAGKSEDMLAGSADSQSSSTFGSCTSSTSYKSVAKTSSGGSVKKPPPPPKPKSLERGKRRENDLQPTSPGAAREEEGDRARTSGRVVPPKKPPRTNRESVKKESARTQSSERGGGDGGEGAVPPPKPARRHRSMKTARTDQEPPASTQRKAQTIHHRAMSGGSRFPGKPNTGGVGNSATPKRPFPAPRPRSSPSQEQTEPPAPTVRENVAAKLSEESIDLTVSPYSSTWGEWGVPALLLSRYARELDQPPEQVALVMDEIRIQHLKNRAREYKTMKMTDAMRNTSVSTDTIPAFLTSIGLPMYTSVFTRGKGFFNVPSLRGLKEERMKKLGIAPEHRGILMEQIRHTK